MPGKRIGRISRIPAVFLAGLGMSAPAVGQAPVPTVGHDRQSSYDCKMCHASHGSERTLKTVGPQGTPEAWLALQAPGTGLPTASCLRCHWSDGVRTDQHDRQFPTAEGRYLGPDLDDDHPLGSIDPLRIATRPPIWPEARARSRQLAMMSERPTIECSTCHDPHALPDAAREAATVCRQCHVEETNRLGRHATVSCTGCHAVHGARQPALLHANTVELMCTRCHTGAGGLPTAWQAEHSTPEMPLTVSPGHNEGSPCEECHSVHQ